MAGAHNVTRRRAVIAAGAAGLAVLVLGWLLWRQRPPPMGGDEDVVKTVDALFTAVTARSEPLLGQCERRLRSHRDAGKLPPEASDYLGAIVEQARAGRWEAAAERLYGFIKAQRREGAHDHSRKKENGRPPPARK